MQRRWIDAPFAWSRPLDSDIVFCRANDLAPVNSLTLFATTARIEPRHRHSRRSPPVDDPRFWSNSIGRFRRVFLGEALCDGSSKLEVCAAAGIVHRGDTTR